MDLLTTLVLIIFTFWTGSFLEKRHFKKIKKREAKLIKYPYISTDIDKIPDIKNLKKATLVTGEVVISGDFFKFFVSGLKQIFGGRLTTYESILDRARREAILRMREKAKDATLITNVRLEYCMLNDMYQHGVPKCAVIAYGTAITYDEV